MVSSFGRVGFGQPGQFMFQFSQQFIGRGCAGQGIAHLLLDEHTLGEGAKVQADYGTLQPVLGVGNDFLGGGCVGEGAENLGHGVSL